jgi:AcrR family transcriptional regulator
MARMGLREHVLEVAEELLEASPDRDVSTRALCEAAGINAPTLYRLFSDKARLMSALVDHGFDRYLAGKRKIHGQANAVHELCAGWDSHLAYALAHPAVYRLMYSPTFSAVPASAGEALRLLKDVLTRCAADGLLRVDIDDAAQAIMSANVGVALCIVTQSDVYIDPELSHRVRDAVHRTVLADAAFAEPFDTGEVSPDLPLRGTAAQLHDLVADVPTPLSAAELALLREWLQRLARPR